MESDIMEFTMLSLFICNLIGYYGMACEAMVGSWLLNSSAGVEMKNHNFYKLQALALDKRAVWVSVYFRVHKITCKCHNKDACKLMQIRKLNFRARCVCTIHDEAGLAKALMAFAAPFVYTWTCRSGCCVEKNLINFRFLGWWFMSRSRRSISS